MKNLVLVLVGIWVWAAAGFSAFGSDGAKAPATVKELFADFDPRKDPLEIKLVREWKKDGLVFRYVTFHVGTFKGKPARMAAFYAFPQGAKKVPGLLHLHGGGQRAFLHEVEFYAKRGYPCLSINWGGREMEDARPGDLNTDWGAVDPTQKNVPGYNNIQPGEKYLDPFESPHNNNWFLLTLGAQRGLTFLERQPEVDAEKIGVYGHSMGGNLTVYLAGSDPRVKAASPSVGGSGFRTAPWPLVPRYKPQQPNGDVKLFDATLGFESYAPRIAAPLLWLGSTNDFHGIMDDTYRTGELIPHRDVRYVFTPHMNHRFTPEFAASRPLWFDQHLKGAFTFPKTPDAKLTLETADHVPVLRVEPDMSRPVQVVHVYYSIDPDPRARFWRSAEAKLSDGAWTASLPILSTDQPLFAFANVLYEMPRMSAEPFGRTTERFALSSMLRTATPSVLRKAGVHATDKTAVIIDDFAHGWRDWYALSPENPHHWEFSTRKLNDPKWKGRVGQQLSLAVSTAKPNDLVIVLTENFFRPYRGKQREFLAVVKLAGGKETQSVSLAPTAFATSDGEKLASWDHIDLLSFRAYYEKGPALVGSKAWAGPRPTFQKLWWSGGS